MSAETQASEQALRYVWNGTKVTLRFTGKSASRLCALMKAKWDSRPRDGLVDLHKLHTQTQSARVIQVPSSALNGFDRLARHYDIMYAVIQDRQNPSTVELMVRGEDMDIINRIFEECSILERAEETCRVDTEAQEPVRDEKNEQSGERGGENPPRARPSGSRYARDSDATRSGSERRGDSRRSVWEHVAEIRVMLSNMKEHKETDRGKGAR